MDRPEWTFLRLELDIPQAGLKIVDYNFLAEYRTSIQGHKDFIRGGKLVSQTPHDALVSEGAISRNVRSLR